ncbi:MAG: hypothetical protein ABSG59_16125 [Verrucomicrobiota bacterium]
MRTKTMLLSALLGTLGSVSLMAQSTNVYSLNAVGYINVTLLPGFNMVTCPLITSPDNTIGTLFPNGSGTFNSCAVYFYNPATGYNPTDIASSKHATFTNGWELGGTNVAAPGVAFWFQNNTSATITNTFVGTVPQGAMTNVLVPGFNMVASIVPTSGDLVTNSITALTNYTLGDVVYVFNPVDQNYDPSLEYISSAKHGTSGYNNNWITYGDPVQPSVSQGFWYQATATVNWVENFSVNQ